MKIYTKEGAYDVSNDEAVEFHRKWRLLDDNPQRNKIDITLRSGQEIPANSVSMVGYDCDICKNKHIMGQKCDMEIVGNCVTCDKPVHRFIRERHDYLGITETFCMQHSRVALLEARRLST